MAGNSNFDIEKQKNKFKYVKNIEKHSKTIFIALSFLMAISIWITYHRTLINNDFEIYNYEDFVEEDFVE